MRELPLQLQRLGLESQPRPVAQVRQLLSIGSIVRWVGLVIAGIVGAVAAPRNALLLVLLILGVATYNALSMWGVRRMTDVSILQLARTITVLDEIGCLVFLFIFQAIPGGAQSGFYVPIVIEAVAFDRLVGAAQSVVVFVVGIIALQGVQLALYHQAFSWSVVLVWSLIIALVATALAVVDRITQIASRDLQIEAGPGPESPRAPSTQAIHLSPREQEVLRLLADGLTNAMIATRLHLSETTVKTYVESLRTRLGARNRAEAVAAAHRRNLL